MIWLRSLLAGIGSMASAAMPAWSLDPCAAYGTLNTVLTITAELQGETQIPQRARLFDDLHSQIASLDTEVLIDVVDTRLAADIEKILLPVQAQIDEGVRAHRNGALITARDLLDPPLPDEVGPAMFRIGAALGCSGEAIVSIAKSSSEIDARQYEEARGPLAGLRRPLQGAYRTKGDRIAETKDHPSRRLRNPFASLSYLIAVVALVSAFALAYWRWARRKFQIWSDRERRKICHHGVTCRIGRTDVRLTIVDFTRHGMRLRHSDTIRRYQIFSFDLAGRTVTAKVIWFNTTFAGIELIDPLNPDQLQLLSESDPLSERQPLNAPLPLAA